GNLDFIAGDYAGSMQRYSEGHAVSRDSGDRQGEARCLCGLANAALRNGVPDAVSLATGLKLFNELGDRTGIIDALVYAAAYLAESNVAEAAACLRGALGHAESAGYELDAADKLIAADIEARLGQQGCPADREVESAKRLAELNSLVDLALE